MTAATATDQQRVRDPLLIAAIAIAVIYIVFALIVLNRAGPGGPVATSPASENGQPSADGRVGLKSLTDSLFPPT